MEEEFLATLQKFERSEHELEVYSCEIPDFESEAALTSSGGSAVSVTESSLYSGEEDDETGETSEEAHDAEEEAWRHFCEAQILQEREVKAPPAEEEEAPPAEEEEDICFEQLLAAIVQNDNNPSGESDGPAAEGSTAGQQSAEEEEEVEKSTWDKELAKQKRAEMKALKHSRFELQKKHAVAAQAVSLYKSAPGKAASRKLAQSTQNLQELEEEFLHVEKQLDLLEHEEALWLKEEAALESKRRWQKIQLNVFKKKKKEMEEQQREREAAATKIQSLHRGRAARAKTRVTLQEKRQLREEERKRHVAATKVQSAQRGRMAREAAKEERRQQEERRRGEERQREVAATRIQSLHRGRAARQKSVRLRAERAEEHRLWLEEQARAEEMRVAEEKMMRAAEERKQKEATRAAAKLPGTAKPSTNTMGTQVNLGSGPLRRLPAEFQLKKDLGRDTAVQNQPAEVKHVAPRVPSKARQRTTLTEEPRRHSRRRSGSLDYTAAGSPDPNTSRRRQSTRESMARSRQRLQRDSRHSFSKTSSASEQLGGFQDSTPAIPESEVLVRKPVTKAAGVRQSDEETRQNSGNLLNLDFSSTTQRIGLEFAMEPLRIECLAALTRGGAASALDDMWRRMQKSIASQEERQSISMSRTASEKEYSYRAATELKNRATRPVFVYGVSTPMDLINLEMRMEPVRIQALVELSKGGAGSVLDDMVQRVQKKRAFSYGWSYP